MSEMEELHKELNEALEKYKIWCEKIDKKEILSRNTEEEKDELDKQFKSEIILPIIAKIKWLQLTQ